MDTYSHLIFYTAWPDTGALIRRLDDGKNTKDGKPGNMYIYLGSTEEERQKNLQLFKGWIGNWTLKRWNEIAKEELDCSYPWVTTAGCSKKLRRFFISVALIGWYGQACERIYNRGSKVGH